MFDFTDPSHNGRSASRPCPYVANSACAVAPPATCIPFDYPDTGCNARAHRVGTILADHNIESGKVWLFDEGMRIATRNFQAGCTIGWFYHVAPYIRVRGRGQGSARVLDPALFPDGAVSVAEFLSGLHSQEQPQYTRHKVYQLGPTGGALEDPGQCDDDLQCFRQAAADRDPQPPYC